MKRSEAEKLLGGYATGTLTEDERRALFAAALGHQAIFDALMEEELLRELLADPEAKARLLAALAGPATPRIVPFWRRTGILGAAASLLVASLAGIAYLRSPNALPRVAPPATLQEPAAKVAEATAAKTVAAPPVAQAPAATLRKSAPALSARSADQPQPEALAPAPPAPKPLAIQSAGAAVAQEDSARMKEKADFRRAEVRDQLDKKAEARPAAAAAMEVDAANRGDALERKAATHAKATGGIPGVSGNVVGGVVSGVVASSPTAAKAKVAGGLATHAAASPATPTWTLEAQPEGRTRVTVSAPRGQPVTLLRRSPTGVEVLLMQVSDDRGKALVQWRVELRLAAGDVLDLYLLNAPVAEPAQLPETDPVNGFRARIYPVAK